MEQELSLLMQPQRLLLMLGIQAFKSLGPSVEILPAHNCLKKKKKKLTHKAAIPLCFVWPARGSQSSEKRIHSLSFIN